MSNSKSSGNLISRLKLFVRIKSLDIFERSLDSFSCSKYFIKFSNNVFIEDMFDVHDKFDILILFFDSSRLIEFEHVLGVAVELVFTLVV